MIINITNILIRYLLTFLMITLNWMLLELMLQGKVNARTSDAIICSIISFYIVYLKCILSLQTEIIKKSVDHIKDLEGDDKNDRTL